MIYTNELFSKLTDIKVTRTEKEFRTYQDIVESRIPVYSPLTEEYFGGEEFKKLVSKSRKMNDLCIDELIYTRNAICVTPLRSAMYSVKNNLDDNGNPVMKVTDLSSNYEFVGFLYEKASPFAEKFNLLMRRMVEFAVFPDREMNSVKLHRTGESSAEDYDTVIEIAFSFLFIGLFSSIVVFTYELVHFSMVMKKNRVTDVL